MEKAIFFASFSFLHFSTFITINFVAPSPSATILLAKFNKTFFTAADSREPESAGILGAVVGSALTLTITILFALPLAVMASIYLEYFAKPGK